MNFFGEIQCSTCRVELFGMKLINNTFLRIELSIGPPGDLIKIFMIFAVVKKVSVDLDHIDN